MKAEPIKINWHPGLSIYASEAFLKTVGDEFGWLGGLDDEGTVRCILPYTIVRKASLRMVRFRVETIPNAAVFDIEHEKAFLNKAVDYFRAIGADMIIPASTNAIFRVFPQGSVAAPYGSYVIDLTRSEDVLFSQLSATHRKKIRSALRDGVQIRCGFEYAETAYQIVKDTLRRSSLGFMSRDAFMRLILGLGENVKLFIAEHNGIIQGCTLFPFSAHSAYSLYGGAIEGMVPGAMNLLNWEAIKLFRNENVQRFDFVGVRLNPSPGSKQEGIMTFKQRFGGELKRGYIWKYPLRPLPSLIYSFAARVLRGGDIVDQEKHKLNTN